MDTGPAAHCFKVVGKRSGKQLLRAASCASLRLRRSPLQRICMSRAVTFAFIPYFSAFIYST